MNVYLFIFNFLFYIGVRLIYKDVLVSGVQQRDLVTHIHTSILFIFNPSRYEKFTDVNVLFLIWHHMLCFFHIAINYVPSCFSAILSSCLHHKCLNFAKSHFCSVSFLL